MIWRFAVITDVGKISLCEDSSWKLPNLADAQLIHVDDIRILQTGEVEFAEDIHTKEGDWVKYPMFTLGEIMIVDEEGIEAPGFFRKPWKYNVKCEVFDDLDDAIQCQMKLLKPINPPSRLIDLEYAVKTGFSYSQ